MVPRRLYERDSQPQLQRRYPVPKLISWIVMLLACTALIVLIATITKSLWQDLASGRSDRLAVNKTTVDSVAAIPAASEPQQFQSAANSAHAASASDRPKSY